MSFLEVQHLSRQIEGLQVVNDVCFSQQPLQKMAIAGETGSGKSNLLKIIAGFTQPDSGHVFFRGERVEGPWEKLIPGHPGIAYLSQQYELPKFLRVEQVLTYANKMTAGAAGKLYEICRITHLMKRRTDQLSGGEQQRIAIARLLIGQPALLLLDEPFSNLDPIHKQLLKTVLSDAAERLQLSCLLTSHDPMDTLPWADDMLILKAGTIVQQGRPEAIYRNPINTYVAGLSGPYNLLSTSLAAAFGLAAAPQGQQVFVRPETLQVVPDGRYTVSGEVVAKRFMGNGYELEVLAEADRLLARTRQQTIQAGDTIRLGLADHTPWFL